MSDPIEERVRQIEALVGEAASVAHRYQMKSVGSSHLLYVMSGTEEGRRMIEELGGNSRRIRSFLERAFEQNTQQGLATGGTEIDPTIHQVVNRVIKRARTNGRVPQLTEILQEMTFLGEKCMMTRQALIVGGVIETMPNRVEDDFDLDEDEGARDEAVTPDEATPFDPLPEDEMNEFPEPADGSEVQAPHSAPAEEVDEHMRAVMNATRDLTVLARRGELDDVIGVEDQVGLIIETISKKKKPNMLISGEPGIGKTALAEGLAMYLASDQAPKELASRPLLEIALPDLVAGARFRGDFEARMRALVTMAKRAKAILFLDEVHLMIGAGSATARGGMDAANILKPALARGEITVIGATTPGEMRELRQDGALMRRFDQMVLKEPDVIKVRRILDEAVSTYVMHHKVLFDDDMLDLTVGLCDRYLPALRFPDKAFNVIDQACVLARKRGAGRANADDVRQAVERNGSVRLTAPDEATRKRLAGLEGAISKRVFDQPEAVKSMSTCARTSMMGMNQGGTAGAYLFNGPSGVGKTEMAYAFAEAMQIPLVRIDMSEFMERHSVSRLIGAPPGYVGFDHMGILAEAADKYTDFVLLFDEAEKAHPDVYDILLQILDYGYTTSGDGRPLFFGRAHVILSANIGAAAAEKPALGFGRETNGEEAAKEAITQTFRKEMLARIPNRIQFHKVTESGKSNIARKAFMNARQRYADSGYDVTFDESLVAWILSKPEKDGVGGRAVQDRILEEIHDPVVQAFLADPDRRKALVTVKDDELVID
jgi:ATP-dependent Clp protease ATP-binding subunit ClpA